MCELGRKKISEISAIKRDLVSRNAPTEHYEVMNIMTKTTEQNYLKAQQKAVAEVDTKARALGYDTVDEMLVCNGYRHTVSGNWFDANDEHVSLLAAAWEVFDGLD